MEETWKNILTLADCEASSYGRIRVSAYQKAMPHGGTRIYGGIATYGQWDGERFHFVHHGKTYKVARLVCEAFNGLAPFPGAVAMHDDENSRNNVPTNLIWGTQKQNLNYPGFINHCKGRTGENSPYRKGKNLERRER